MELSVVLPSYMEEENLKILLPEINEALDELNIKYEVLIIDAMDNIDKTSQICKEFNAKHINREGGNSYGDAIRTGINKAKYNKILVMDSDGSHPPAYIHKLFESSLENDLVIGSRYTKGGKTENNKVLILMSMVVNISYRKILKIKVNDISNSYRIYNSIKLKKLKLECSNFDIVEEILVKLILDDPIIKIIEIPIEFKKRLKGESKRDLFKFGLSYVSTILRLLKIRNEYYAKKHKESVN
jgi:dolichol-phosphate mannosyltransferase